MKKSIKIIIVVLLIIAVIIYGIYWLFSIQRLNGQEEIEKVVSPNGKYTVVAYLNNGGATVDFAVLCSVVNNETGKERNIYWNYHCTEADIQWIDNKTVVINEIELDVLEDTYDFRKEP